MSCGRQIVEGTHESWPLCCRKCCHPVHECPGNGTQNCLVPWIGDQVELHDQLDEVRRGQSDCITGHRQRPSQLKHLCHRVVIDRDDTVQMTYIRLSKAFSRLGVRGKIWKEVGVDKAPADYGYELTDRAGGCDISDLARSWSCSSKEPWHKIHRVPAFDQLQRTLVCLKHAVAANETPARAQFCRVNLFNQIRSRAISTRH